MLTKELFTQERTQLRFIEPMYAEAVKKLPDGEIWTYEAKLDGYGSGVRPESGLYSLKSETKSRSVLSGHCGLAADISKLRVVKIFVVGGSCASTGA